MTTPRIEEMVEHFFTTFSHIFPEDSKWTAQVDAADAGWIRGYLESALTEAHQAGIDEAVERVNGMKRVLHKPPEEYENNNPNYLRMLDIEQSKIDIYNQALDDTIKTLQDNK